MTAKAAKLANRRIRLLLALFGLVFAITVARAVWLQAVQAAPLAAVAEGQHRATVAIPAGRGAIFDRTGVQLAIGEHATTVYADPRQVRNPQRVAAAAAEVLGVSGDALYPQLLDRKRAFVYVQRKADPERAQKLAARKLPGLGFYPEERRGYPQRSVAAHVLGFVDIDNRGLEGLERVLDPVLAGKPGSKTVIRDPAGRVLEVVKTAPERPGRDVYLTLDRRIQANAEAVLAATVKKWRAAGASAIVLDPKTGGILAMANAPGFDANAFSTVSGERRRNRAVTDTYEPGSTFKIVTVAAALSEGLVTPATGFTLAPTIRVADRVIHEAHRDTTLRMTVADIVAQSSNIGTITLAQMLGKGRLAKWIDSFGFGHRTGIDFPGETQGLVLPPADWSGSTIGNVPIGQGIAVTPLQMASAYATIANGGIAVQPHLVDRVVGSPRKPAPHKRVLAEPIASQMRAMLLNVVEEQTGTGTLAAIAGYRVAGKTGTAAKPDSRGGYSTTDYVASFVGFVPATSPRLVISVTVDRPRGVIWGGVVAAPAFRDIARFGLQHLEVPPDAPSTETVAEAAAVR